MEIWGFEQVSTLENNANLFTGRRANVLHKSLGLRFQLPGFLSHLHPWMVTMSYEASVAQVVIKGADAGPDLSMCSVLDWLARKANHDAALGSYGILCSSKVQ